MIFKKWIAKYIWEKTCSLEEKNERNLGCHLHLHMGATKSFKNFGPHHHEKLNSSHKMHQQKCWQNNNNNPIMLFLYKPHHHSIQESLCLTRCRKPHGKLLDLKVKFYTQIIPNFEALNKKQDVQYQSTALFGNSMTKPTGITQYGSTMWNKTMTCW